MIVKNEVKVLPRLFRSLKNFVDYYVIVDTGSTDDTISLIQKEMSAYGIDGEVHERPWVNFGTNRQEALELAVKAAKSDWVLFIDADEELGVSDPEFYKKLKPGVSYNLEKHQAGMRYAVPHLMNIKASQHQWAGPVHNYLLTVGGSKERALRTDVWIIYHSGQGAKSHGLTTEEKYLRDARLLEDDLKKHPESTRSQFYLGQSYRDAGHDEKAYDEYEKRAAMQGWIEEKFIAQLEMGRLAIRLEKSADIILRDLLSAFNIRPLRAEPLHELARYFRNKKMYGMAFLFAKAGASTKRPADSLYVPLDIYEWRMLDELGVSAYWVEDYVTSLSACEQILARMKEGLSVPEADAARIRDNIKHAQQKLEQKSQ